MKWFLTCKNKNLHVPRFPDIFVNRVFIMKSYRENSFKPNSFLIPWYKYFDLLSERSVFKTKMKTTNHVTYFQVILIFEDPDRLD